jgi:hypothetical protein
VLFICVRLNNTVRPVHVCILLCACVFLLEWQVYNINMLKPSVNSRLCRVSSNFKGSITAAEKNIILVLVKKNRYPK